MPVVDASACELPDGAVVESVAEEKAVGVCATTNEPVNENITSLTENDPPFPPSP